MQIDWDEALETDLNSKWLSIAQDMSQLHNIFIDRRYISVPFDHTKFELDTFTDASTKAYDAITFFNPDGHVACIMVKSCVVLLKPTTLSRLELMDAVTWAQITKFVMTSLTLKSISTHTLDDCQIVFFWT